MVVPAFPFSGTWVFGYFLELELQRLGAPVDPTKPLCEETMASSSKAPRPEQKKTRQHNAHTEKKIHTTHKTHAHTRTTRMQRSASHSTQKTFRQRTRNARRTASNITPSPKRLKAWVKRFSLPPWVLSLPSYCGPPGACTAVRRRTQRRGHHRAHRTLQSRKDHLAAGPGFSDHRQLAGFQKVWPSGLERWRFGRRFCKFHRDRRILFFGWLCQETDTHHLFYDVRSTVGLMVRW